MSAATKWEYKWLPFEGRVGGSWTVQKSMRKLREWTTAREKAFNSLGAEGWELVETRPVPVETATGSRQTVEWIACFKRPLE
jgi:hypothetical protein